MNPGPAATATEEGQVARSTLSDEARDAMLRRRGETVFLADWTGLTFLHFEVDPDRLQEVVPFPLDRFEGRVFVSLVAFTMRRFRPAFGGRLTSWITAPLATQRFLNLRTYVRGPHGPGIYFMHEWLDHPLAVRLGPSTFGLPYRRGNLSYQYTQNAVSGTVVADGTSGNFSGIPGTEETTASPVSRDEFLQERYLAYTAAGIRPMAFRVWHDPWRCRSLTLESLTMTGFLESLKQPWTTSLRFAGAAWSEGVRDVWMGRPLLA
jgi:uncharacterized protein YqjF (DUF2071 family)